MTSVKHRTAALLLAALIATAGALAASAATADSAHAALFGQFVDHDITLGQ